MLYGFESEVDSDSGEIVFWELVLRKLHEDRWLSYTRASNENQFDELVILFDHYTFIYYNLSIIYHFNIKNKNQSFFFVIKKVDSGAGSVIITVEGGGNIDGQSSLTIYYQYTSYSLMKSGSNYIIL